MKKGITKMMFIIVTLLLITFLASIVITFVSDFIGSTIGGGKPLSVVSDLLGGL